MPRPPLIALIAAATVALLAGAALGGGGDEPPAAPERQAPPAATPAPEASEPEDDEARRTARRLSIPQLAGAVNIMRFAGSPLPAYVFDALRNEEAAGVILFQDNLPDHGATTTLTAAVQRAARGRALVATDQEGGAIRNLPWLPPAAAPPALTSGPAARRAARATARGLRSAGINVNLAPIADLGGGPVMGGRAFRGGPAAVARLVAATVRAYRGTGVVPTVKHFPGLGAATANTDDAPATIRKPAHDLGATDLPPFRAAIAAGVPLVMLSHARYPALDRRAVASQSRVIVTDLLKRRLGFAGVAITDSIEARAVSATMGPGQAAVRSVRAGIDLVLTTGPGSHLRVYRALQRAARRSPAFRARLTDAAARVLRLRRALRG